MKIANKTRVAAVVAAASTRVSLVNPDWLIMWSRFLIAKTTSASAPARIKWPVIQPMDAPKAASNESWKSPRTGDARSTTESSKGCGLFN